MEIIGAIAVIVAVLAIDMVKQRLRKHVSVPAPGPSRIPEAKATTPPPVPAPGQQRRKQPRHVTEEGIRVTPPSLVVEDDTDSGESLVTAQPDWRDAVIYSEILKTKF